MSESQHTPGSWYVGNDHPTNILRRSSDHAGGVYPQMIGAAYYTKDPVPTFRDKAETYANARLMAAAPDLLAACKALLGVVPYAVAENHRSTIQAASEAIAKAER